MSDYNEAKWQRRNPEALAPATCCSGLKSDNNTFPPTSFENLDYILFGNKAHSYHNQVSLLRIFLAQLMKFYRLPQK